MDAPPPHPNLPPQAAAPRPGGTPKWIFWLIGGIFALAVLCGGSVLVGGVLLMRTASQQSGLAAGGAPIYDVSADAKRDIALALATAKAEQKLVLIDFGADWCPDCVVLSRIFESKEVKPYLDEHYVVVRVNVGQWDANLDVSRQYGDPIKKGIPAVVVLTPEGRQVATTGDGSLANAQTATRQEILDVLTQWVEQR
jgi:thiol:disulfide interchange protein